MFSARDRAFTLVEILIVVVILGVLAAVAVPQFSTATDEASMNGTYSQLTKLRNALAVYYVRNGNAYPNIAAGDGTWAELISAPGYLEEMPCNLWVGRGVPGRTIILASSPDVAWQNTHGWIFDNDPNSQTYGEIWAGGFDDRDAPFPRP
jgi:prepilin-type N-terminal cleavage/methylation domain-containing protein